MNILLTSVGRRSYLVQYFRQVLQGRGRVICTNSVPDTPGMVAADHAEVLPEASDPEYLDRVIDLCGRMQIGLLCSCHDLDVLALARGRDRLDSLGVCAALPDQTWAQRSLDKFECGERLRAAAIAVPWQSVALQQTLEALHRGEIAFPVIVKGRWGFGSEGLRHCRDARDLQAAAKDLASYSRRSALSRAIAFAESECVLFQQSLSGTEYCVQIYNDFQGNTASTSVAEIHSMRAGESERATTRSHPTLEHLGCTLGGMIRHRGPCGIDVIVADGTPFVIDVNPRFTGDYPFHHLAGVDLPASLLAWAEGGTPHAEWLRAEPGVSGFKELVPTCLPHHRTADGTVASTARWGEGGLPATRQFEVLPKRKAG